ncbi:MAG: Grx4 family monothiol glutaredoxin [Solirubrobacterales bacterium]
MSETTIKDQVQQLIDENEVLLFMKGTPEMPRCGFSMRVVQVLEAMDVEYGAVDVLPALEPLREATGEISDWRTFPQLYVNGELLGGADIVQEMYESGELAKALGVEQPAGDPGQQGGGPETGGGEGGEPQPFTSPPLQIENQP